MLTCGLVWYLSGRDKGAAGSWAVARLLNAVMLLEMMVYHQYLRDDKDKIMTKQHQSFGILGATLLTLGHGMCAFRTLGSSVTRHPFNGWNRCNLALLAFLFMVTVNMFSCYVLVESPASLSQLYTDKFKPDAALMYIWRLCGTQFLSLVFYGFAALTSLSKREGTAVLLAGLFACGFYIPFAVYQQNEHHFFKTDANTGYLVLSGTVVSVCLAGTWEWFMGSQ